MQQLKISLVCGESLVFRRVLLHIKEFVNQPCQMQKSNYWIHFPSTDEEIEREKAAWQESYDFPCAIGAIDCTHIHILKPSVHGDEYINRK